MKKTEWINCATPPVYEGRYDVRLWGPGGYGPVTRHYFNGKHWSNRAGQVPLTGKNRPGWHKKDEWRGVMK